MNSRFIVVGQKPQKPLGITKGEKDDQKEPKTDSMQWKKMENIIDAVSTLERTTQRNIAWNQ